MRRCRWFRWKHEVQQTRCKQGYWSLRVLFISGELNREEQLYMNQQVDKVMLGNHRSACAGGAAEGSQGWSTKRSGVRNSWIDYNIPLSPAGATEVNKTIFVRINDPLGCVLSPFRGSPIPTELDPGVTHSASLRAPSLATFCRASGAVR
jgi:hypothetical protein